MRWLKRVAPSTQINISLVFVGVPRVIVVVLLTIPTQSIRLMNIVCPPPAVPAHLLGIYQLIVLDQGDSPFRILHSN